jgi:hypothetical protein
MKSAFEINQLNACPRRRRGRLATPAGALPRTYLVAVIRK